MATILDLLMALNRGDLPPLPKPAKPLGFDPLAPIPLAPVGNLEPLSDETTAAFGALNPEPVPPRFAEPAAPDMNFVNAYSGPAPAPPAPLSRAQRIMNALGGFGAGYRGQGAQYLEQLDEPQRRYEAATERYQGRRAQGIELSERRAEREAAQANRAAELQYEREFNVWLKKTGVRDAEAKERMRQAFDIQKLREAERIADEKQAAKEKSDKERQRRNIEFELGEKNFAPPNVAKEIAGYIVDGKPMSAATEKWRSVRAQKLEAQLARLNAAGGGVASGNAASLERQFNALKARFLRAELGTPQAPRGDRALMERIAGQFTAVMGKLEKLGYEVGFDASGIYPYIKPPSAQRQPAQAAAKTITRAEMAALGVTDAEVKAEGYTIVP